VGPLIMIVAGLVLLWFFRTLHLKFTHPYEGRHALGYVDEVTPTYHPSDSAWVPAPVKNRAWWNARMGRDYRHRHLFMPLADFWERKEEQYWELIEWLGRDYRWVDIPLECWPESWKVAEPIDLSRYTAGSDLPPRALKVVEPLRPFQITVAGRLAA